MIRILENLQENNEIDKKYTLNDVYQILKKYNFTDSKFYFQYNRDLDTMDFTIPESVNKEKAGFYLLDVDYEVNKIVLLYTPVGADYDFDLQTETEYTLEEFDKKISELKDTLNI